MSKGKALALLLGTTILLGVGASGAGADTPTHRVLSLTLTGVVSPAATGPRSPRGCRLRRPSHVAILGPPLDEHKYQRVLDVFGPVQRNVQPERPGRRRV